MTTHTTHTTHPLDTPRRLVLTGYVYTRINGKVTHRYAVTTAPASRAEED